MNEATLIFIFDYTEYIASFLIHSICLEEIGEIAFQVTTRRSAGKVIYFVQNKKHITKL